MKIIDYTIVNRADLETMVIEAMTKLNEGWEPLGGAMPNNHVDTHDFDGTAYEAPYGHTTYTQTWAKREETP